MKRWIYYVFLLMLATGCEKKEEEAVSLSVFPADDIYCSDDGTWVKVKVTTNKKYMRWDVRADPDWCWVSGYSILDNFSIHAWSNPDPVARVATVTVTAEGAEPIYIKVHQEASSFFITPSTPQTISSSGGVIDVTVKSDASWTARSDKKWAVVGTESGTGDGTTQISVDFNPNKEAAVATITFCDGGAVRMLVINQEENPRGPYITLKPGGDRTFPVKGGSFTVSISSNAAWTVSSNTPWARVETQTGEGDGSTRIFVDANTKNDPGTAVIYFRAGTAYKTIEIKREYTPSGSGYRYVKSGYTTVYTIDGRYIKKGHSSEVVYTVDGKYIKKGYSSEVVYTIDGKYIKKGYSSEVVYTIHGRLIKDGYSGNIIYTLE